MKSCRQIFWTDLIVQIVYLVFFSPKNYDQESLLIKIQPNDC